MIYDAVGTKIEKDQMVQVYRPGVQVGQVVLVQPEVTLDPGTGKQQRPHVFISVIHQCFINEDSAIRDTWVVRA